MVESELLPTAERPKLRPTARVTAVYATPWLVASGATRKTLSQTLELGALAGACDQAADHLPVVVSRAGHRPTALRAATWQPTTVPYDPVSWLFALPSGLIVAAFRVDLSSDLEELPPLLDDLGRELVDMAGQTLSQLFSVQAGVGGSLAPERHVVVSIFNDPSAVSDTDAHRLLYPRLHNVARTRERLDAEPYAMADGDEDRPNGGPAGPNGFHVYATIQRPPELNIAGRAWVSPYVTVAAGHSEEIDNALLISTVIAVGSAARLRDLRLRTEEALRTVADVDTRPEGRNRLAGIYQRLGQLESELGAAVEGPSEIGTLMPSRAVAGYHRAVFRALDVTGQAGALGRMLYRLNQAVTAKLTADTIIERRQEARRRAWWTALAWIVLALGLPAAVALGYAGRDGEYTADDLPAYLLGASAAAVFLIAIVIVALILRRRHRRALAPRRRA